MARAVLVSFCGLRVADIDQMDVAAIAAVLPEWFWLGFGRVLDNFSPLNAVGTKPQRISPVA